MDIKYLRKVLIFLRKISIIKENDNFSDEELEGYIKKYCDISGEELDFENELRKLIYDIYNNNDLKTEREIEDDVSAIAGDIFSYLCGAYNKSKEEKGSLIEEGDKFQKGLKIIMLLYVEKYKTVAITRLSRCYYAIQHARKKV